MARRSGSNTTATDPASIRPSISRTITATSPKIKKSPTPHSSRHPSPALRGSWLTWRNWHRIREDMEGRTPANANIHARLPMNEPHGGFASPGGARAGLGRR
jgi:hypothetical protein